MNWIALSLFGPIFWATSNFVDKYVLGKYTKGIYDFLFFSTITSWILFGLLFILTGAPSFSLYALIPIITGVILIYSYGFYGVALGQSDTSSLVILFELIPVLTVMLGYLFLGQTLSANEIVGFIVVLAGATIVSYEGGRGIFIKGLGMILVAIVMWSVMILLIDYGLTKMTFWEYFMLDALGSALAGLTFFVVPHMRRQVVAGITGASTAKYAWFTGNNMLDIAGQMSTKMALAVAPSAGLVSIVMQVQSFYAIIIGTLLTIFLPNIIREDISASTLVKKLFGALVMFCGIYILLA